MVTTLETRIERDTLGEVQVPKHALYGAQTQRAVENFPISGLRFPSRFIRAYGLIKYALAKANRDLNLLDTRRAEAIMTAAKEVFEGRHDNQFVVDIFQTGSGTSTNMNANEVIANRANELLGGQRGDKGLVHPNDHVNIGQSTNDVFPTAIHVAALEAIERDLLPALRLLAQTLTQKAKEFAELVKAGRTHLQDATPLTLGQEFSGYASMMEHGIERIERMRDSLSELPLGGTAVGTGLNAHPDMANRAISELNRHTGLRFRRARNAFEAMQARDAAVEASGMVKTVACSLMKIANDLRLLSSGPRTGLGEIDLPAMQPGSSIMPAKVNPVIPEAVNLVAAQVIGYDAAITLGGQAGQLELNIMMPLIAYDLLQAIQIEANAARVLAERCVAGITANVQRLRYYAESSVALITALTPAIGYDRAAEVAKEALTSGKTIRQIVVERGLLSEREVDRVLDLKKLTQPGRL